MNFKKLLILTLFTGMLGSSPFCFGMGIESEEELELSESEEEWLEPEKEAMQIEEKGYSRITEGMTTESPTYEAGTQTSEEELAPLTPQTELTKLPEPPPFKRRRLQ